ncbi:MAG: hypothetical protein K0R29_1177 [Pseudobdellovibrio sp.]|jgi:hypothetical protein|nr:hypothetical protein [Pseudobdellovibrio sp.]
MSYFIEKILATVALTAAILSEINHTFIQKVAWSGFTLLANHVSFVLIPVWVLAIAGLWSSDRLYKFFQVIGIGVLCAHGLVLAIGGNRQAVLLYFALFVISATCSLFIEWRDRSELYG